MGYKKPRVVVRGMIWHNDQILMVRQGKHDHPRWLLPGGGVDPGESLTIALAREIKEEIGCVDASICEPCALVETIAPESHSSGRHLINVIFRVEVLNPELIVTGSKVDVEDPAVREIKWVKQDEITKIPLHPPIAGYLKSYKVGSDFHYFEALWAP